MARPTHLIVVCCHGIWLGGPSDGADESEWLIAPFQRGETPTFAQHAQAGVRCLAQRRDDSVLVFSGGPTRSETRLSEARSYASLAARTVAHAWWDAAVAEGRVLLEERALDSYHNVLFALTLFRARVGAWPTALTLVGHAFKHPRLEAHCAAIGLPPHRLSFVGIDPPPPPHADGADEARRGVARAEDQWRADPHGRGPALAAKRRARNPWGVWQGVFVQDCRDRGGLVTRGEGEAETLVEDASRPWCC